MFVFEEIVARIGNTDNPPTFAELEGGRAAGAAMLKAVTTPGADFDIETARDLAEGIRLIDDALASIQAAEDAALTEATALRSLLGESDPAPVVPDPAPAVPEPAPAVEASATTTLLQRLRTRAPVVPNEPPAPRAVDIRAVGPSQGFELSPDADVAELGHLFATAAMRVTAGHQPLVRITKRYDESRVLNHQSDLNVRKIADVFGAAGPLTAAGGLCGPGDVDFTHPVFAQQGRPVRDALTAFNASRGKVTLGAAVSIADTDPAVSKWTLTDDQAAVTGSPTKPCPRVLCPEDITCEIQAVVHCMTIGNIQAKFTPEYWAARLQTVLASVDRKADQLLLQQIHANSTPVPTVADGGNTLVSFLAALERTIAGDRGIQRNTSGTYQVLADAWLLRQMVEQVAFNLSGNNRLDAIQALKERINSWLADMGAQIAWTFDGTVKDSDKSHNIQSPTSGAWLTQSTLYVYPVGSHLYLDGGTLDLGTSISDSALNAVNDRQAFAEIFEKSCFRGISSYRIPLTVANKCGC